MHQGMNCFSFFQGKTCITASTYQCPDIEHTGTGQNALQPIEPPICFVYLEQQT